MPKTGKIADCVRDVMKKGNSKEAAIKICQKSTGLVYATGKPPRPKGKK